MIILDKVTDSFSPLHAIFNFIDGLASWHWIEGCKQR